MPQIPALLQPWPPEQPTEEYDVFFIPTDTKKEHTMLAGDAGDTTDFILDDGEIITIANDGSTDTQDGTGVVTSDNGQQTTIVANDPTTGNQTTTTIDKVTNQVTKVTTGLDANGIVQLINSGTKIIQAIKGTGNTPSNIFSQPIGTAIPQANGTVITRNANGTITTFDPRTGQTSTTSLPGSSSGLLSGNNLLIIGALAIGALVLAKRK